jgi:hypothetical protein
MAAAAIFQQRIVRPRRLVIADVEPEAAKPAAVERLSVACEASEGWWWKQSAANRSPACKQGKLDILGLFAGN